MDTMTRHAILPGLLLLGACSGGGAANDQAPAPTALVALGRADNGAIDQTVTLYGVVQAGAAGMQVLSTPAEAIVRRIVAPVGSQVSRGQIVVELAPAPNTKLDLAKASADARTADAAYARAKRLRADGLVSDAEVETARAAAASADATRASLSGRANGLTLKATAAGYVQSIAANPGDLVAAGTTIATIAHAGDVRAQFGADPAVARALHASTPIRIEATAGRPAFSVPISSVNPGVDPQTRLASVFAKLPASAGLAIGETLQGTVAVSESGGGVTVPYAALLDDGGQPYVFVVASGVAHRHDVVIGPVSGERVAITKGMKLGENVVTTGGTAVEDGMKVRTK